MKSQWTSCKLGDVITLQRGFDLPERERRVGDVPIVTSSGITGTHDTAKVKGPGVVTGRYGTLGEVYYIKHDFWPHNTTLFVKDFKGNHPLFVRYFLETLRFAAQNAAGAVPGVNRNALHLIKVLVPPYLSQLKIASILSCYDELIENNAHRIQLLEEMAQLIYREWFVNFRFPGHENVKMVESELGMIPEGWEVRPFGEIAMIVRHGISPFEFEDETFAHFSIPAFDEGQLPKLEHGVAIRSNKYLVEPDCVLLSKLNPRIARVWLPFVENQSRPIASTEFLVLKPSFPITRVFLFVKCRSDGFQQFFAGRALGTSTSHQRVKPEDLEKLPELIPPTNLVW